MKMTNSMRGLRFVGLILATALLIVPTAGTAHAADDSATVYQYEGKNRVHLKECRRFEGEEGATKMTYADAQEKGLPLCSRCPGSDTPSKDDDESDDADEGKPTGDTIVYHAEGKKRVHVEECRRLESTEGMQKMTLAEAEAKGLPLCSRCPGSTTDGKGNPEGEGEQANLPESWVNPAPSAIKQFAFERNQLAPLVSMGADGKLVYRPYSEKGDQLMDWSHCGYKNSSVPIPEVDVAATLEPSSETAKKVGNLAYPMGADSHQRIQQAVDKVAAMRADEVGVRGAVLLKKGTYYVTGTLIIHSGVVLRGEGDSDDGTVLIMRSVEGGGNAIHLGEPDAAVEPLGEADAVRIVDDYVPSGSKTLTLTDTGSFKVGDFVHVRKTPNDAWIELLGMGERLRHIRGGKEGLNKRPWKPESYQFRHLRQITAIDGSQITLDAILPQSFELAHGGGDVYTVDVTSLGTHCGIEGLQIVSNYDTTVQDTGKEANFLNFHSGIVIKGAYESWVRDCTVKHMSFAAANAGDATRQITVRDSKNLVPVGPKRGGNRYAFNISGGTLHLFYNCFSEDGRHDFALGSRETGPFAFVKCEAVDGGQSEPHHRWSTGVLYDNVITKSGTLAAINRGDSGSGHGWAAANTMIWNCDATSIVVMDPETSGENNFAIGFRGTYDPDAAIDLTQEPKALWYANSRAGYWGTPAEGRFYGYPIMGNGYIESPDGPVKPDSLFVQQLSDRIGKDKATQVLE